MAIKFSCPSCGADLIFQSSISIFATCSFCQSTVVRKDMDLESLGKTGQVIEDMSVIQLGTRGTFDKSAFQIIGRIQMKWDGGFWNEWFAGFDDGKVGWIAEAQGSLMISFEDPRFKKFPLQQSLLVNTRLQMSDLKYYFVKDIRRAEVVSTVGELPLTQVLGQFKITYDLSSEEGGFATLDYGVESNRDPLCYLGSWQTVQSLKLTSLREFEGWVLPTATAPVKKNG
ncbi:MAG: DUF4178 domain-containing protein [Pseudobdellovibrionaceae bacterium]